MSADDFAPALDDGSREYADSMHRTLDAALARSAADAARPAVSIEDVLAALAVTLDREHYTGQGCGTSGVNACSNCFGGRPYGHEVMERVAAALAEAGVGPVAEPTTCLCPDGRICVADCTGTEDQMDCQRSAANVTDVLADDRIAAALNDRIHDWLRSTSESYAGDVGSEGWIDGLVRYLMYGPGSLAEAGIGPVAGAERRGAQAVLAAVERAIGTHAFGASLPWTRNERHNGAHDVIRVDELRTSLAAARAAAEQAGGAS